MHLNLNRLEISWHLAIATQKLEFSKFIWCYWIFQQKLFIPAVWWWKSTFSTDPYRHECSVNLLKKSARKDVSDSKFHGTGHKSDLKPAAAKRKSILLMKHWSGFIFKILGIIGQRIVARANSAIQCSKSFSGCVMLLHAIIKLPWINIQSHTISSKLL